VLIGRPPNLKRQAAKAAFRHGGGVLDFVYGLPAQLSRLGKVSCASASWRITNHNRWDISRTQIPTEDRTHKNVAGVHVSQGRYNIRGLKSRASLALRRLPC
jgi:hypothetical protein